MTALRLGALAAAIVFLPLAGAALAGREISRYLEFPPLTARAEAPGFDWGVFVLLAAVTAACVAPLAWRVARAPRPAPGRTRRAFPWWGWLGAAWLAAAWLLAWSRFPWFAPLQQHTFTPLWLGYVVVVNALSYRRSGHCMLRDRPWRLLALFALSAAFWWTFEYLNRFVRNWHYEGIADFGPVAYTAYATLSFSTVLPAVLSTREWLDTWPRLSAGLGVAWRAPRPGRAATLAVLAAGAAALAAMARWPGPLFPLVWVAPLLLLVALDRLAGRPTLLDPPGAGDWREIWLAALAALVCGLLWELWNWRSLAHWEYTVPYVQRFHLFEMPALGYAGYLPFGLTCVAAADFFLGRERTPPTRLP